MAQSGWWKIKYGSVDCKDVQTNFELYQLSSHSATLNHIRYFIVLSSVKMNKNAFKSWKFFIICVISYSFRIPQKI